MYTYDISSSVFYNKKPVRKDFDSEASYYKAVVEYREQEKNIKDLCKVLHLEYRT